MLLEITNEQENRGEKETEQIRNDMRYQDKKTGEKYERKKKEMKKGKQMDDRDILLPNFSSFAPAKPQST